LFYVCFKTNKKNIEKTLGPEHGDVGTSWASIGGCYQNLGEIFSFYVLILALILIFNF